MQLINATGMQAAYNMGLNPDGRELLVVVVKGTFSIPSRPSEEPRLLPDQAPIVASDIFTGKPGFSAPLYESDYAPLKPRCDVLLNGSAYAPGGVPTERVVVGLRVGPIAKSFTVLGNRTWKYGLVSLTSTRPEPFVKMPISYDNAFGGIDDLNADPKKHRTYLQNHAGIGYYESTGPGIDNKRMPNTEESTEPIRRPNGKYRPMAFGSIGRAWQPRPTYAGTYDKKWLDNVFPFLPADFQDDYYQAAPIDQQMPHPHGGELVELVNLAPSGRVVFPIPTLEVPIEFSHRKDGRKTIPGTIDAVLVEPDQGRFMVSWRAATPLKKNMFEITQVVVGKMPSGWYRARAMGTKYYSSLKELVIATQE
jgi:hypothetical protein